MEQVFFDKNSKWRLNEASAERTAIEKQILEKYARPFCIFEEDLVFFSGRLLSIVNSPFLFPKKILEFCPKNLIFR
jgi:hypothetical protein